MNKESFVLRFIGLVLLAIGIFWFWKSDFALATIFGVPIPTQFLLMTVGLLTLTAPAPFLRVVALFLPKEYGDRFTEFVNKQLSEPSNQLTFDATDKPEQLAEKLNKAVFQSKRRFYVMLGIIIIFSPLLIIYIYNSLENKKTNLLNQSNQIVKAVQNNPLSFSSADTFRRILSENSSLKNLPIDKSSSGKIYKILEDLYNDKIIDEISFNKQLSDVFEKEIKEPLQSKDYNFETLNLPVSETDPKDAKASLFILLATICNQKGENGRYMEPLLFGRGILNQIETKPNVYFHISGWNYGGLLKSTLKHKLETYPKLTNIIFPNRYPSKLSLAAKALSEYTKYKELDTSSLAFVRSMNNVVDIQISIIYFLRVKREPYTSEDDKESEISKLQITDVNKLFQKLVEDLEKTKLVKTDSIIFITKAQLYSLEGEVNMAENTENSKNVEWCLNKRNQVFDNIKSAFTPQTKETFSFENREISYLKWVWDDPVFAAKIQELK